MRPAKTIPGYEGTIQYLLNEIGPAFRDAPFRMVSGWGQPWTDCRHPAENIDGERIPTEIGVLLEKDGKQCWLSEVDQNDLTVSTGYKVMLVMYDPEVATDMAAYNAGHLALESAPVSQIEGAPHGIVPAWMSGHAFGTPFEEASSLSAWHCGFNCGRQAGTAETLAHYAKTMTTAIVSREVY